MFKTCEDEQFFVVEAILAGKGKAISGKNLKPNAIDVYRRGVLRKKSLKLVRIQNLLCLNLRYANPNSYPSLKARGGVNSRKND